MKVAQEAVRGHAHLRDFTTNLAAKFVLSLTPQWGAADAEIKVPSGENTELKRSPFKAWSRSVYIAIHATLTPRDFFLAYFYTSGPFTCIFFQNLSRFFPC